MYMNDMTWFRVQITVGSAMHEPVRISGSSHGSIFELLVYRVHNEHNLNLLLPSERVQNRCNTQSYTEMKGN